MARGAWWSAVLFFAFLPSGTALECISLLNSAIAKSISQNIFFTSFKSTSFVKLHSAQQITHLKSLIAVRMPTCRHIYPSFQAICLTFLSEITFAILSIIITQCNLVESSITLTCAHPNIISNAQREKLLLCDALDQIATRSSNIVVTNSAIDYIRRDGGT